MTRASRAQDLWIGGEPRLRGCRRAPFEPAAARILFLPDRDFVLDRDPLADFLESLGSRLDVLALEPRGQGGSGGCLGPEVADDLRKLLNDWPHRFADGLPLVLAGHGAGGALALGLAEHPGVGAVVALAPCRAAPPDEGGFAALLAALGPPRPAAWGARPVLLLDPRDDPRIDHAALADLARAASGGAWLQCPGDLATVLAAPWPEILASWVLWAAGHTRPA